MSEALRGKIAWITGGGRGLGAAIAERFAAEGAEVVVSSREAGIQADVRDREQVDAAVAQIRERFGRIDVLVNNAGVYGAASIADVDEADWTDAIETNLGGPYRCSQAALKLMPDGGRIIHIGSIHGLVGDANAAPQCASKFGLIGLAQSMAQALRTRQITVNVVCPGAIDAGAGLTEKVSKESVAALCAFLASAEAAQITGAVISIPGTTHAKITLKP